MKPNSALTLALALTLGLTFATAGCGPAGERDDAATDAAPARPAVAALPDSLLGDTASAATDRAIFRQIMEWAHTEGVDTMPIGERVARIATRFVGNPYTPQTLEAAGPERLVINLREFDCVTLVESALALARVLGSKDESFDAFRNTVAQIRYRGGELSGYPSRLHYFSEWISDNTAMGIVRNITHEIGGVVDPEPFSFMTAHRDAYRQLGEPGILDSIRALETRLSAAERYYIPEENIAGVAGQIQSGDVIAATSTLPGLDIAHTGIALWQDGKLHLIHAQLVGKTVEISEVSLADRILRIDAQDGIMVARPLEP